MAGLNNLNNPNNPNNLNNLNIHFDPIHKAASKGNVEKLRKLLAEGVSVNTPLNVVSSCNGVYFKDVTPLFLAAQYGKHSTVKFLLERGADPEIRCFSTRDGTRSTPTATSFWFWNLKSLYYLRNVRKLHGLLIDP